MIGVGLLAYLGLSGSINWSALLGLAAAWKITLVAIVLMLLDVCVTAWRVCVLLNARHLHLSLLSSLRLTLMGNFFNVCLPGATGGDVMKIYYAAEGNNGRRTEVATIILLDRAVGMFALLVFPLLAAPLFPQLLGSSDILRGLLWIAALTTVSMLAGMLICSAKSVRNSRFLSAAFRKLPFGNYAERVFDTVHAYRKAPSALVAAVGISLLAHALAVGITLLIALAINRAEFSWQMSVLVPLGFLANTLPLTPGGIGVGEAAFNSLFAEAGLRGGAEILLGWRVLMILTSSVGFIFYLQGRKRFVHASLQNRVGEFSRS